MIQLHLRPGHDRRIRRGHPWVFSNEIQSPDKDIKPGETIEILSAAGEYLGTGYYNPHSLIAGRILSRQRECIDCVDFYRDRLLKAMLMRKAIYGEANAVRLVHGEGDHLPGLVVDRYDNVLSVQFLTLGMDCRSSLILQALTELFNPGAIVGRNNVAVRDLENLPRKVEILQGDLPDRLEITENGLRFKVDVIHGQKTGHFLDQKENHLALRERVTGKRVLDLFCYSGSWAIHAARYGAKEVVGIDISPGAITLAQENARLNFQEDTCNFVQSDVFESLRQFHANNERFGGIILDPPAFIKNRKRIREGVKGYLTINRRAMELLEPDGILFTCTCSHHMDRETFLDTLRQASFQAGREMRLLEIRGQSYDHPVLCSCPETEYLKCAVLQACG
ncbi:MAG: class I SAM-dependent rRNA methyltransferase [Pedobacter sp.]